MHGLPRDPIPAGDLGDRRTGNDFHHCVIAPLAQKPTSASSAQPARPMASVYPQRPRRQLARVRRRRVPGRAGRHRSSGCPTCAAGGSSPRAGSSATGRNTQNSASPDGAHQFGYGGHFLHPPPPLLGDPGIPQRRTWHDNRPASPAGRSPCYPNGTTQAPDRSPTRPVHDQRRNFSMHLSRTRLRRAIAGAAG
jgi:hypothetical protein